MSRSGIGVVTWCATVEPGFEITHRMREAPFLKHRSTHGRDSTRRESALALLGIAEQPSLEHLRVGVFLDDAVEYLALQRKTDGVRRLIALAALSATVSSIKRGEESSADIRRAE